MTKRQLEILGHLKLGAILEVLVKKRKIKKIWLTNGSLGRKRGVITKIGEGTLDALMAYLEPLKIEKRFGKGHLHRYRFRGSGSP
jgi:hypothetical protein